MKPFVAIAGTGSGRRTLCVLSALLLVLGAALGPALADACAAGAGCPACLESPMAHLAAPAAGGMDHRACLPTGGETCGDDLSAQPSDPGRRETLVASAPPVGQVGLQPTPAGGPPQRLPAAFPAAVSHHGPASATPLYLAHLSLRR